MHTLWLLALIRSASSLSTECTITSYGAVPGNRTADARNNTLALEAALSSCELVRVPSGAFKVLPFEIPSHRVLYLSAGSTLVGSDAWEDYGETRFLPPMGDLMQLRPLVSATNATNVTIAGGNGTIDGNGWFAWPWANWSSPECGMHKRCAGPPFFGPPSHRVRAPYPVTFTRCTDVTLSNITITNPAMWGVQHFFCNRSLASHVTILAPRWTRGIAGFMPYSVLDYRVQDSFVYVGDDAVAIMSGADESGRLWTTRGVIFQRLFARGRSVAIGSAVFGNISDVLFDECTIGDDQGSSPWAFKIKMHANHGNVVSGIVVQNSKLGKITNNTWQDPGHDGGTALFMGSNYDHNPVNASLAQPHIRNISFVNVTATLTRVVGSFDGGTPGGIAGLRFVNCNFHATSEEPWALRNVDAKSCASVLTTPPFPVVSN